MTAPAIASRTTYYGGAATSHAVSYEAGTVTAGNLMLCYVAVAGGIGNKLSVNDGWSVKLGPTGYADDQEAQWILYKLADGTEGGTTFTITLSGAGSRQLAAVVVRITGASSTVLPYVGRAYHQTGTTAPDPPSVTHPLGDEDYLCIASASSLGRTITAYPSGYSNGTAATGTNATVAIADKTTTSATENAGAFTQSPADEWTACITMVYPSTGADPYSGYPEPTERIVTMSAAGTSHTINYPTSTADGDTLLLVVGKDETGGTITLPGGWTTLDDVDSGVHQAVFAWQTADGTEGGTTFSISSSDSQQLSAHVWRITGGGTPQVAVDETQSTGTVSPPSLNMGSSGATLWITGCVAEDNPATWIDTVPSNYFNAVQSLRPNDGVAVDISTFERVATAQSESPGSWVQDEYSTARGLIAFTIGIAAASTPPEPLDQITPGIQFAFGDDPLAASPTWVDVTDYVREWSITRGRSSLLSRFEAGTGTIRLDNRDGRFDPNNTSSPYSPDVTLHCPVRIVITHNSVNYVLFRGMVEAWPLFYGQGAINSWVDVPIVDLTKLIVGKELDGFPVAGPQGTIEDILENQVGWPAALISIEAGLTDTPSADFSGSVYELLGDIETTDSGTFFVAADGTATYYNRTHFAGGASTNATFSDEAGGLYYEDIRLSYDDDQLYNRVVTSLKESGYADLDTEMTATQRAGSASSISAYGEYRLELSGPFESNAHADNVAEWNVLKYKDVRVRIRGLTVVPQFDEDNAWPQVLGNDLRDAIQVQFTPPNSDQLDQTCTIERITHTVSAEQGTWVTQWELQPLSAAETADYWILGTSELGTDTTLA